MRKCLRCKKTIQENTGRRPRKYCSDNCRQRDYQEKKKENPINVALRELKPNPAPKMEKKAPEVKKEEEVAIEPENEVIQKQIAAIKAEKIPELRNKSVMGRKSWELDQKKRIQELENQLK